MLKEISIKNFKSFNEETLFTMEADSKNVSEFSNHKEKINGNDILKVASIYGPNGGGKSNLIEAIKLVKNVVLGKCFFDGPITCLFNDSNEIEITIFFIDDKYEIGYNFSIYATSDSKNIDLMDGKKDHLYAKNFYMDSELYDDDDDYYKIDEENIVYRKKNEEEFITLYTRNKDGLISGNKFTNNLVNKNIKLAKRTSIIKYIYDFFANNDNNVIEDFDIIKHLYNEIMSICPLDEFNTRYFYSFNNENIFNLILEYKDKLIKSLNSADIKISDIKIYKKRRYPIYFARKIEQNNKIIEKELPLFYESQGTQKIFSILLLTLKNIEKSRIFYCDDMNAYLHPKLSKALIQLFNDNNSNTQLIFNSHDIINMNNELFRRDEIWFAYRDENYATQLVPLSNIVNYEGKQIRKDAKYNKQYLEGKYGADPFVAKGLSWNE